ncbi:hypothetical protein O6H91_11G032300 [Diphasiastrum complanatum]|uniref:Uncharacterized protein n=1 Tax=Diphasiastrum complanatum TaxID=34168 RepID=A0ACC2C7Q9_DIPCM|nr:hypothetical protein O6H91_11G032300 [Diphasiastrum complanatum]
MVKARTLLRAKLPLHLVPRPSPATPHSHRLAVHVADKDNACNLYLASGSRVYHLQVPLLDAIVKGKENLLIPSDVQIVEASLLDHCPHRAEVQSVCVSASPYGGVLLASTDSFGRLVVVNLYSSTKGPSYTCCPQDVGVGEGSWSGCAFGPRQPSLVVVARGMAKSIDLYDKDMHVRTLHTLQPPTAMTFLDGPFNGDGISSGLVVTEASQLSIWDLRAGERNGCVQRILGTLSGESLYAVCSSSDGMVGTGGSDRSITVFDSFKWTARSRWIGCLKYEVIGGVWKRENKGNDVGGQLGFRGDSRWLGVDKCVGSDVLAGWCESGSIFVSEFVANMES